ncbi:MAG: LysE family translocator [Nocardioidaceae bacterium]|nr:LysE family translocator [Nocardioidaceae bacterium]NUS50255.1 LysE family translocator [Nocardioidaceae bacterium]
MVSLDQLLAFGVAALILIAIPGPSVVFTVSRALAYGRPVALSTVVGNSLGLLVVLVLVAFGLGVVVRESITVFLVLKLTGAAYLVYLGVQAVRHRRAFSVPGRETHEAALPLPRALRQGFVVGVTNPKAFMIFAAVLPQFLDRTEGHVTTQMLLLGLLAFVIGLVSDSVWAVTASQLRTWFSASPRRGEAMGAVGGLSMVGLGVALAVTGRPE